MSRRLTLAALAVAATLAAAGTVGAAGSPQPTDRITVETRNLFVGFDAGALLSGQITPVQAWTDVLESDPRGRAESWADEIKATRPDVIGLQEATLYQTGPILDPAPATTVAFDFVQLLVDALADRGLEYVVAATATNFSAEAPVGPPYLFDLRLTDRDVLLVRDDRRRSRPEVLGAASGNFAVAVPTPFGPLLRGWAAVDLELLNGHTVRVVNTHLEALSEPARFAQAAELLAGPGANPGATILIGDFNSGPPAPTPTYALLTAGFDDVWPAVGSGDGLTCCHDDLTTAIPYTERIDLVLVEKGLTPVSAEVIGDVPAAEFPFFPSDHAGVVATVKLR